jgi:diacylglycerol kinase (ATP)
LKIAIILNGISLKKKFFYSEILPELEKNFSLEVFETRTITDAITLASTAVEKQYEIILAAGGDGTLNQVVNGIVKPNEDKDDLPVLGLIPLGSGNDFARTINMRADAKFIVERIKAFQYIKSDIGKIICKDKAGNDVVAYFINVADAGMGPEVVKRVMRDDRLFGPGFAYYQAILSTFFSYKPMPVTVKTETWAWQGKLRSLAIGNGRFYGHGMCIAPEAKPDDGIFSSFIGGDLSVAEFIWHSGTLKRCKKVIHPKVLYNQAKQFELTTESACAIEADGEWIGYLPARIEIIPARLKILS